jgi:hypothetical protein
MVSPRRACYRLLLAAAAIVSCSDPSEENPPPVCPEASGEFAVTACAVLAGQVLDTAGRPLTDVHVSFHALRPCNCTEFLFQVREEGEFRHTIDQFGSGSEPSPDTVTVMVSAAATGAQYPHPTPETSITDSVPALLTFRPAGELPVVTFVQIRLPIP